MRLRRGSRAGGGRPERADRAGGTRVEEKVRTTGMGLRTGCVARRVRARTEVERGALDHGLGGIGDSFKGAGTGVKSRAVFCLYIRLSFSLRALADLLQQREGPFVPVRVSS